MYIDSNSLAGGKALAECPFLPFALAEAARFCKKYPGRFDLGELQNVAVEAMLNARRGFKKAIAGALADFARDGHKVVRDVEVTEEEFERTRGGPPSNAKLLAGPGKASSKHGKVRLALGRSRYNDGWSQFGRFKDPWWRGENLFSPAAQKNPVRGELICERDAPSRPAQTTAARSGSLAGRGDHYLPPTSKPRHTRRAAIVVRLRPRVKPTNPRLRGTTPFYSEPILEDAPHLRTRSLGPKEADIT